MPLYHRFEDLPAWQEAARLYHHVLDLLESPHVRLSYGFRNQIERAALSVSNNIAEGFERLSSAELSSFLSIARGSAGEVRSMIAVIRSRPGCTDHPDSFDPIRCAAESCTRQLTGWLGQVRETPWRGKPNAAAERAAREGRENARQFKLRFLRSLKPSHPLYDSAEARAARNEIKR